ncbi:hypothetical protein HHK36_008776 [Tetracentron sinense]|uniref:Uncharacterized protein n=1 Tax=Tetracentron sinense TaxID=13715 RepID=A0A834ZG46_TETSI|nr:hypothetical protein HHK36_008776 [Tetracentron sinense]
MHQPKRWHTLTGKGMCAIMWFWVFYRAKQDGPVVLGWRHPWEGHEDHSHGHGQEHEHELAVLLFKHVFSEEVVVAIFVTFFTIVFRLPIEVLKGDCRKPLLDGVSYL